MSARLGIIGGYLGAGKSTLVNHLLVGAPLGRTAVVVNDFGSVNIDADLVASADGDTIELTNGCICCQVRDDTSRTMSALAARGDLDHVLCEVSGVGDPGQLTPWRDFPGFTPGPVVVCADATSISRLLRDEYVGDTVERQLRSADVVLVTKTDLASASEISGAVRACREIASRARLVLASPQRPDLTAIEAVAGAIPPAAAPDRSATTTDTDDHHGGHDSRTIPLPDAVDVTALVRVLQEQSGRLARAKGVVRGSDGDWHEVQLAGRRVDVRTRSVDRAPPSRPVLVLIAAGPSAQDSLETARAALLPVLDRGSSGWKTSGR